MNRLEEELSGLIELSLPPPLKWIIIFDDPTDPKGRGMVVASEGAPVEALTIMLNKTLKRFEENPTPDSE